MSIKGKDHFSGHAACYQQFRPNYPEELFAYLASLCPNHRLAWDCATGNGQAAVALARHFDSVIATDLSTSRSIRQSGTRKLSIRSRRPIRRRLRMERPIS